MLTKKLRILTAIVYVLAYLSTVTACVVHDLPISGTTKSMQVPVNVGKPEVFEITKSSYFGEDAENLDLKSEFVPLLEKELGCKVKINYPPHTEYMTRTYLKITSGELKGLVKFFDTNDILKAIGDGTIEPLDEYLKDNENWNSMPDEYKDCYKFNGKTYAIPGGFYGALFTRSFRKDWLDNLGLEVPETTDDLLEVARAFTENDPDGNGLDDTYGLVANRTWNLQDIFQAFDVRLNCYWALYSALNLEINHPI